jgi:hypothetical protein
MAIRIVMISSTVMDLAKHRAQVMSACLQQNLFPKMMEHLPASDANAIRVSMQLVDEADLYVGVIGFRYGYVPRGRKISITEMEYERAGQRKIPRLMFLMSPDHPLCAADVETGPGADQLHAFRERIRKERVISTFNSPEDLRADLAQALSEFRVSPDREELVASQILSVKYRVAVVNQAASVSTEEVRRVVAALQTQVSRDLAATWGIDAQITLVEKGETPPDSSWWLNFEDRTGRVGLLGYHDVNAVGLPMARIGIKEAKETSVAWSVTASHVLLQLLANPNSNAAIFARDKIFPREICRPCSGDEWGYDIDSTRVSDFVLPAWFDTFRAPGSTRFDFCGHLSAPFQALPGTLVVYFEDSKRQQRTFFHTNKPTRLIRLPRRASQSRDPKGSGAR